ncbi:hypothetical protein ACQKL5_11605 [Peribacillus sp. NPDC097675]|uniref:hypothetical protein n=1 Tax=Peribacillus sp. NPDC097675 TaxID=3390618 RepID=UPI003D043F42
MAFKQKNRLNPDVKWFSVGILTDHGLEYEEYETLSKRILDAVNNVGAISDLVRVEWDKQKLKALHERFKNPVLSDPCFIINEVISEDIEREKKLLQEKHKWKRFLNLISQYDYLEAETKAVHDFDKSLLYTDDIEKVIEFLTHRT